MSRSLSAFCRRFQKDAVFRASVTLLCSLGINFLYGISNAALGIAERSMWFGTLAAYHLLLGGLRLYLLFGQGSARRRSRVCGGLLLAIVFVFFQMAVLFESGAHQPSYPWFFIYGVATYAFFAVGNAVRNVIKYRRLRSFVGYASKVLCLANALVAIYSLQYALIGTFGEAGGRFQQQMGLYTGIGISLLLVFLSFKLLKSKL